MSGDATSDHVDVAVVGAGLAGLSAARRLHMAGKRVVVLEARGEVGGRTHSRQILGQTVDFGGEWIGRSHRRMRRLVREFGLHIEPARQLGYPLLWRLPTGQTTGRLPPLRVTWAVVKMGLRGWWLSRRVDPKQPWGAPSAAELDATSVAEFFDQARLGHDGRAAIELLLGSLACEDLDSMSLLQLLWFFRMAGGPVRSFRTTFQWRIAEGTQEISRRIANELGDENIRLNSPVSRIEQCPRGVDVVVADEVTLRARRAIVATPVPRVADMEFDPPLPKELTQLTMLNVGAGTKVIAGLPVNHRVKHNAVLGGRCLWGAWRRGETITGFAPPMAGELTDAELISDLAAAFGLGSVTELQEPTVFRWAEQPYIQGCEEIFAPGKLTAMGPRLITPHGLVGFAGVARSSWPDNMEGAVESGERAAGEALAAL